MIRRWAYGVVAAVVLAIIVVVLLIIDLLDTGN